MTVFEDMNTKQMIELNSSSLERVNRIWSNEIYQNEYVKLQELERKRIFCGHSLVHFLDTARLMWIRSLEEQAGLNKEIVYAAGLLHDLGRARQYIDGMPHDQASADLAEEILPLCGFDLDEISMITEAIGAHRRSAGEYKAPMVDESTLVKACSAVCGNSSEDDSSLFFVSSSEKSGRRKRSEEKNLLAEYLHDADKQSRNCMCCAAEPECNWAEEKKNYRILG